MKRISLFLLGIALLIGLSMASNMGFKIVYPLEYVAGNANTNFVSLPYFYFPDGNMSNNQQMGSSICDDVADGGVRAVASVVDFNPITCQFKTNPCQIGTGGDFEIVPGHSYAITPKPWTSTFIILGSHDDRFDSPQLRKVVLRWVPGSCNANFVSVPYHTTLRKSHELCDEINSQNGGNVVAGILRFDVIENVFVITHAPRFRLWISI